MEERSCVCSAVAHTGSMIVIQMVEFIAVIITIIITYH